MKYSKPLLMAITAGEPVPVCINGSSASVSGCMDGSNISEYCDLGSGNFACYDGGSATECASGDGASRTYGRCLYGTSGS